MSKHFGGRAELAALFKETVLLYLRLSAVATALYGLGDLSGPRRTLLLALAESGPQTVARLARVRAQSRQRLQPLINKLIDDGLVRAAPNPMHQQSPLMVLTPAGKKRAREIEETEGAMLAQLRFASSPRQLGAAAAVLREVRETIESQAPELLATFTARRRRSAPSRRAR
jgi:DNA-binding MarR family transcriptional regulator